MSSMYSQVVIYIEGGLLLQSKNMGTSRENMREEPSTEMGIGEKKYVYEQGVLINCTNIEQSI